MTDFLSRLGAGRAMALAAALAALAGLAGAFTLPVMDRDEGRYAQATAQMLESGDPVRIQYLDEPRNKKPVGIHWLQSASVALVSDVEARRIWAWRLPSLLGAALAAMACFLAGRILLGAPAAFAGAAMLAVSPLLGTEAGLAKTDAALLAAATLMMAAMARLRFRPLPLRAGRWTAVGIWAALAVGVLIKGPIAPLLAGLTLVTLFAWERRWAWARPLLFWPGPLLFLILVLPWFAAVELAGQGFLREAVGVDLAPKLVSAAEGHSGPPGYHTLALAFQLWPATLYLLPGAALAVRAARVRRGAAGDWEDAAPWRFLLAWAIPFLVVLELTPTKLSHYGLPAYPAFALIAGAGVCALLEGRTGRAAMWASAALYLIGAGVLIAVPVALAAVFGVGAAVTLAVGFGLAVGVLAFGAVLRRRAPAGLVLALAAALVFHIGARGAVAPRLAPLTLSERLADAVPQEARPAAVVGYAEPSFVFHMGGRVTPMIAEAALDAAAAGRFPGYVVPRSLEDSLSGAIRAAGGCPRRVGGAAGLNYSNGDEVDLTVIAARCQEGESASAPR